MGEFAKYDRILWTVQINPDKRVLVCPREMLCTFFELIRRQWWPLGSSGFAGVNRFLHRIPFVIKPGQCASVAIRNIEDLNATVEAEKLVVKRHSACRVADKIFNQD